MITIKFLGTLLLISPILCQYYGDNDGHYRQEADAYAYKQPPPQILTHKQAQNHDGNFKYLFTSENGLEQGESIAPDGSRNGGYSYIDPTGRKISVKYTAGKEGFRILEADHLPKAPVPVAPVPGAGLPVPQQQQQQQQDDGHYRPELYQNYVQPKLAYNQPRAYSAPVQQASANTIHEPQYNDEPGKAYSFGNGFAFEFGG